MARFKLNALSDTLLLGHLLARQLTCFNINGLFLQGPLGCGKTTLVRSIVENLPGAEDSEISSPSFTIYNRYPTTPQILHCDLYRCRSRIPDELLEQAEFPNTIIMVEWCEYFPAEYMPADYLRLNFEPKGAGRLLTINSYGKFANNLLRNMCNE